MSRSTAAEVFLYNGEKKSSTVLITLVKHFEFVYRKHIIKCKHIYDVIVIELGEAQIT